MTTDLTRECAVFWNNLDNFSNLSGSVLNVRSGFWEHYYKAQSCLSNYVCWQLRIPDCSACCGFLFSALWCVVWSLLGEDMRTENGTSSDESSEESHAHHDWWIWFKFANAFHVIFLGSGFLLPLWDSSDPKSDSCPSPGIAKWNTHLLQTVERHFGFRSEADLECR